ncbi:MAG: hypothetical protein LUC23_02510 [Prevotellaceae bacterium]|nr:hypothetical protein [Prevotellaceae bacterium]
MKCETDEWDKKGRVVRTTFHPDSDYSTFVGCYKPTMRKTGVKNPIGNEEESIVYEFVPQAFLKAYVNAWKDYPEPEFLVVEEINRGNCAQIFGDLFQLLDRNGEGMSEYPIDADNDLKRYIADQKLTLEQCDLDDGIKESIKSGEKLLLPDNLYIRATMNTSDQSLFPIDSAFKRRWDWRYIPIAKGVDRSSGRELNWVIEAEGKRYDWWAFLQAINKKVFDTTNSEDKQLGFFFCKADKDGVINAQTFVSKVIFYLWNDVFKDYGFDDMVFNDQEGEGGAVEKLSFDKFYLADGTVNTAKVVKSLSNLSLTSVGDVDNESDVDEAGNEEVAAEEEAVAE